MHTRRRVYSDRRRAKVRRTGEDGEEGETKGANDLKYVVFTAR